MKAITQDSGQPISKLDSEFAATRLRMKHLVLMLSIAAGIFAASLVRPILQDYFFDEPMAEEGDIG